ncbi:MAG TPA: NUDIX domain-containing protein [Candidatus Propionivibrio aalborgensis]|nr:NUDIX domain-containing protein [Candidatus Propionivibrio aalborgensis]
MKYCPLCRSDLENRPVDGVVRLACSSVECQFVSWNNPIPVVAGLVRHEGQYLLARNATWPQGMFSMITGFLEQGESPESAILRETEEELGLKGSECKFIGHYAHPRFNQLIIAFAVEASGDVKLNDEIAEVRMVSPEELATYDFGRLGLIRTIVTHWLERA